MKHASIVVILAVLIAGTGLAAEFSTDPNAVVGQRVSLPDLDDAIVTITHSANQAIVAGNSVSCNNAAGHTDNSYMRRFNLPAFGILAQFDVTEVEIGIESATSTEIDQPVEIRLYSIATADSLTFANLTLLNTLVTTVAEGTALTILTFPITGSIVDPSIDDLVVEFFTPNGQATGASLFIGSNPDGQTAPGYMAAADCGIPEPLDTAAIGFPDMHIVMNVTGDAVPVELMSFSIE